MKPIYFNCKTYTSPVEWCDAILTEMVAHDIDVECIELYPLHEKLDTEAILAEMSEQELRQVVGMVLNHYK